MAAASHTRIAVVGCGGIGSCYAFQLARSGGHEVTVVARPGSQRLRQLQADGGIFDIQGERADVEVADALDESVAYDLIIVTVLAHQVDAVLPALRRSKATCVQFMFNTFAPERLREAVGPRRCALGMPFVQASIDAEGRLKATIGAGGQKSLMDRQASVAVFNAAGIAAALEPDMARWLRCHVPVCVTFESVSVAAVRRGGGATWQAAMARARGLHAGLALVSALEHRPLYPAAKVWLHRSPTWLLAALLWSLTRITAFRELLALGASECRALIDDLVQAAPSDFPAGTLALLAAMRPQEDNNVVDKTSAP